MVCEGKSGNALIDCLAQKAAARDNSGPARLNHRNTGHMNPSQVLRGRRGRRGGSKSKRGGSRRRQYHTSKRGGSRKSGGSSLMTNLLVPLGILGARRLLSKRLKKKGKKTKRKTRRRN